MPGGHLGILLLLIALLSMHGAQYLSAGTAPHGAAPATVCDPTDAAAATALPLDPVAVADGVGGASATRLVASGPAMATATPGHGIAAHVWALCLAVLLAGLVLLGTALARMTTVPVGAPASRSRVPVRRFRPPRPPDLSALCLLRI